MVHLKNKSMKQKIKKIAKKMLLVILLLIGGSILLGIIQEEVGYGLLHFLVALGIVFGFVKIVWGGKKKTIGDYGMIQEDIDNYNKTRS